MFNRESTICHEVGHLISYIKEGLPLENIIGISIGIKNGRMGCFSHSLKRAERSKIYNLYLGGLAFQKYNNFLSNLGHCLNSGNSRSDYVGAQRVSNKSISLVISDCFKLSQSFTDIDMDFYQEVKEILLDSSYISKEELLPIIKKHYDDSSYLRFIQYSIYWCCTNRK